MVYVCVCVCVCVCVRERNRKWTERGSGRSQHGNKLELEVKFRVLVSELGRQKERKKDRQTGCRAQFNVIMPTRWRWCH